MEIPVIRGERLARFNHPFPAPDRSSNLIDHVGAELEAALFQNPGRSVVLRQRVRAHPPHTTGRDGMVDEQSRRLRGVSLALETGRDGVSNFHDTFCIRRTSSRGGVSLHMVNPDEIDRLVVDKLNNLLVLKPTSTAPVSYWAGFAWDRAGKIDSARAWTSYVDQFAEARRSPIAITLVDHR